MALKEAEVLTTYSCYIIESQHQNDDKMHQIPNLKIPGEKKWHMESDSESGPLVIRPRHAAPRSTCHAEFRENGGQLYKMLLSSIKLLCTV